MGWPLVETTTGDGLISKKIVSSSDEKTATTEDDGFKKVSIDEGGEVGAEAAKNSSSTPSSDLKPDMNDPLVADEGFTDVLGTRSLYKKVLHEAGEEQVQKPEKDDMVTIRVFGRVDRTGKTIDRIPETTFQIGHSEVIPAWDIIPLFMKSGEVDLVKSSPRFAYGAAGRKPDVNPGDWITYEIQLLKFSSPPDLLAFDSQELKQYFIVDICNELIKNRTASSDDKFKYTDDMQEIMATCNNNLAAVHLKVKNQVRNYEQVVASAAECLLFTPKNEKALFRMAKGYVGLKKYSLAINQIKAALTIKPNCEMLKTELRKIQELSEKEEAREKRMYQAMFADVRDPKPAPRLWVYVRDNSRNIGLAFFIVVVAWIAIYIVHYFS